MFFNGPCFGLEFLFWCFILNIDAILFFAIWCQKHKRATFPKGFEQHFFADIFGAVELANTRHNEMPRVQYKKLAPH